jgi:hypothetical protein
VVQHLLTVELAVNPGLDLVLLLLLLSQKSVLMEPVVEQMVTPARDLFLETVVVKTNGGK